MGSVRCWHTRLQAYGHLLIVLFADAVFWDLLCSPDGSIIVTRGAVFVTLPTRLPPKQMRSDVGTGHLKACCCMCAQFSNIYSFKVEWVKRSLWGGLCLHFGTGASYILSMESTTQPCWQTRLYFLDFLLSTLPPTNLLVTCVRCVCLCTSLLSSAWYTCLG